MGAITYDMEVTCSIPAAKMYKAFVLDADNLIPKILPQAIKSVETLQGDGGAGTIKITTFGEGHLIYFTGSQFKSVKHRVDALDKDSMTYSYRIVEGDALMDILESISYHIKVEALADGGSVCKNRSIIYHTKGDAKITEGEIKAGKEKAMGMFKAVDAYLLANPDAY